MDLMFPQNLKPNITLSSKPYPYCPSSPLFFPCLQRSSKPWRPRTFTPASKLKHVRIRSEFEGKVNGAFSADFDPRFIDRVSFIFMFIFMWGSLITKAFDFTLTHFLFSLLDENPFLVFFFFFLLTLLFMPPKLHC